MTAIRERGKNLTREEKPRNLLIFYSILEEHDSREGYVDWANRSYLILNSVSSVIAIYSLVASIMLLNRSQLIPGFLVAGVCGACVNVLLKFPRIMDYGENVTTMLDIFGRAATGALASMIGFGFLASGILSLSFTFDG